MPSSRERLRLIRPDQASWPGGPDDDAGSRRRTPWRSSPGRPGRGRSRRGASDPRPGGRGGRCRGRTARRRPGRRDASRRPRSPRRTGSSRTSRLTSVCAGTGGIGRFRPVSRRSELGPEMGDRRVDVPAQQGTQIYAVIVEDLLERRHALELEPRREPAAVLGEVGRQCDRLGVAGQDRHPHHRRQVRDVDVIGILGD